MGFLVTIFFGIVNERKRLSQSGKFLMRFSLASGSDSDLDPEIEDINRANATQNADSSATQRQTNVSGVLKFFGNIAFVGILFFFNKRPFNLMGTPSQMTTAPINLLNVLKTQVLPVMGLCPSDCKKIKIISPILPVPVRRHVDAHTSLADKFQVASDINKPACRHLGKRNSAFY